jgi:methionyl-tRNA synthetase
MQRFYITTAIPYVNGDPHLGHALELVQADVLARHRRLRGQPVRFLSGTDDNALKNVDAALAAGAPVAEFVARSGQRFADLAAPLQVSLDDVIRTGSDPRHRRPLPARVRGALLRRLRGLRVACRADRRPLP